MVILDLSVVNVAIPSIQADLGLAQADLQWVVVTYGVTLGGSLMLGGRAADLLGRRRVLAAGLALFTAASFGAGLANSLTPLMASRAAQGVGAALAATAALSIVVATFADGAARTKALGIFAAVGGSAASIGVIVSGALTDGPGWEWIFLVNVPIGIGLIALVFRFIAPGSPEHGGSTDIAGAVAVTGGLMAIVFAISRSTEEGLEIGANARQPRRRGRSPRPLRVRRGPSAVAADTARDVPAPNARYGCGRRRAHGRRILRDHF